ncbi:hypothetical protein PRIPAC_76092 [Pristionchus pacificus]|nr:hypothetical protein PRIPAC_76092 [Pristionchus pacificus]
MYRLYLLQCTFAYFAILFLPLCLPFFICRACWPHRQHEFHECEMSRVPIRQARNMGTHLFFVHGYSKNKISEWRMNLKADILSRSPTVYDIFRCSFCPKTYRRQNSCRAHERVVHCVASNMKQKCVPCPVRNCVFSTTALLDLCAHAKESHSEMGDFSIREARFENLTLFQAWRLQYEENTQTVLATESVNSNAAAGTTLRYLRCAQLEAQIRKLRNQMKQAEARGNARRPLPANHFDDEEDEVRENQEREEAGTSTAPLNSPGRHIRKGKFDETAGRVKQEKHEGFVGVLEKKEDEELQEGDNEEEEIDVEQLDEQAPRLMRASSAHRDDDVDGEGADSDDDHDEERRPDHPEQLQEQMKAQHNKMNSRHCTAHMRVLVLGTGAVHVEYCVSHLGHDVFPIPPASRSTDRAERTKIVRPMTKIPREVEEDIERAKKRRKGRRETEHRWRTERRMRTERDEFAQLCNRYDDIGANVELYEAEDMYDDELPVEEVIEEEIVEHDEMVAVDEDKKE